MIMMNGEKVCVIVVQVTDLFLRGNALGVPCTHAGTNRDAVQGHMYSYIHSLIFEPFNFVECRVAIPYLPILPG